MKNFVLKLICLFTFSGSIIQCKSNSDPLESSNYRELKELIQNSEKLSQSNVSFVAAAALATPCVVHIKTKINVTVNMQHPFQDFFGNDFFFQGLPQQQRIQKQESSGSGVIFSEDGYIVTNYHVVQNAQEIEVTLRNKNTYKAKIIGQDKDTDLAIIKIEESKLPFISIANSDEVMVGEWVLAVGNPFNLESTVTQGIVSAKGRSLNLQNQREQGINPIESFIQTDAAVNPGNSGGALVNIKGELIGINTAIASPTGAYAGYAFAVPSNLVKKVISDLKSYGTVQRAYLGIEINQLTADKAKTLKLPSPSGVLVKSVLKGSGAEASGLKMNDVIVKIDQSNIASYPELLEHISKHSPGDKIEVTYYREGSLNSTNLELRNKSNKLDIVKIDENRFSKLGIALAEVNTKEKTIYRINSGIKVTQVNQGIISNTTEMKSGFIILNISNLEVKSIEDFKQHIQNSKEKTIYVEGFYPGRSFYYKYAFNLDE